MQLKIDHKEEEVQIILDNCTLTVRENKLCVIDTKTEHFNVYVDAKNKFFLDNWDIVALINES